VLATGAYAQSNEYRFSTKPLDATSGLYYYGYRFYDPSTGRWPNRDPIKERGGLNLYGKVNNNLVNKWNYLGLCDCGNRDAECSSLEAKKLMRQQAGLSKDLAQNQLASNLNDWVN